MNKIVTLTLSYLLLLNCRPCLGYYCKDREVGMYGTVTLTEYIVYDLFRSYFSDYRQNFNMNTEMKLIISTVDTAKDVVNQSDPEKPVIFSTFRQQFNAENEIVLPLLAQPIVIIFNLPNVNELTLTLKSVADIYKGKIKFWDELQVFQTNPSVKLPHVRILPIARQDTQRVTEVVTQTFSTYDPEWNKTYGTFDSPLFSDDNATISANWPKNSIYMFGYGPVGLIGLVNSIPYSIGYCTFSGAVQNSAVIASLMVDQGNQPMAMYPTIENVNNAMYWTLNQSYDNETLDIQMPSKQGIKIGYPMSAFLYIIMKQTYDKTVDCCMVQELVGMVDWAQNVMNENLTTNLGYIPLIGEIKRRVKQNGLNSIQCVEGPVYQFYTSSMTENTSQTWQTAAILLGAMLSFVIVVALGNYVYQQKFNIDINRYLIIGSRITTADTKKANRDTRLNETTSLHSQNSMTSGCKSVANIQDIAAKALKQFMIPGTLDESKIFLDTLLCKIPQQWSMVTKRAFAKSMTIVNKNVAALLGLAVINFCPFAVFEHCSKGTLHYVLRTSRYNITEAIKFQFALGVVEGLKYLHSYHIVHGYLSSITCYLDASWTLKICQWEQLSLYQHDNNRQVVEFASYDSSDFDEARLIELIYVDPNLKSKISESCDVSSFGYLLVEIFSRRLPYAAQVEEFAETYANVFSKKFGNNKIIEPSLKDMPVELQKLCSSCLSSEADKRPKTSEIYSYLQRYNKKSGSILEIIMDALEAHNDELEEKVTERTADLNLMNEKMEDLLHEVLPPQVAEKLLSGIPVLPEYFECVTIYYSDIAGFTSISAKSTPIEVMTFLNDLWLEFDGVMEKLDVYKVDTIGDAYFVCSGLPIRNGSEHARQISLLSLGLMDKCNHFKIRHLPEEQLKVRIGVHSGPVGAGIVGSKMPQYCIFGDTVNIAVTMESSSMSQRIQISETTYQLLSENFSGQFELVYRHETSVEGNKLMKTFWLNREIVSEENVSSVTE